MDSFYYNLLNIGKKKISEEQYNDIINRIIEEETELSKRYNPDLDRLCKVISININNRLKEINIDTKIINTKELLGIYEHQFILSSYVDLEDNINYVLIDPTYTQFDKQRENFIYSADILRKTKEGNELLEKLLLFGYSKIDDNNLKRYLGSLMYEEDINKIDINISDIVLERIKR